MLSCQFCEISHNTIFKERINKKVIKINKNNKKMIITSFSEKLKLENFLSLLQILYTDHIFLRSSVT